MVVTSILLESFLEIGAANGTALNSPVAEDYNIHRQTSQLVRAGVVVKVVTKRYMVVLVVTLMMMAAAVSGRRLC